jgi:ribosome-associated protein
MPEIKENFAEFNEVVSKSQRRRDALETKSLARDLIAMSPSRLARLPLDEDVRAAIEEARQIRAHGAGKRQLQFVAKLLRRSDPEAIIEALDALENDTRQLNARQHRAEAWRDHLVGNGDPALGDLLQQRPGTDAQAIRQCIRKARSEADRNKPPAAARTLFRLLREMDEHEPLPPLAGGRGQG